MTCSLQDAGEFVQAHIGPTAGGTLLDCYGELLSLCTEHRIARVLVISDQSDATTHEALVQALEAMSRARLAAQLRLAILAPSPPTFHLYRSAEPLAAGIGITARVFRTRAAAVHWLTGRPPGERASPRA